MAEDLKTKGADDSTEKDAQVDNQNVNQNADASNGEAVSRKDLRKKERGEGAKGISSIKDIKPWVWAVIGAAIVAIIVIIVFVVLSFGDFVKAPVKEVNFYSTKTTKDVTNGTASPQSSFAAGDPILLSFGYEFPEGPVSETYAYRVVSLDNVDDEGNHKVVRNGSLPITADAATNEDGSSAAVTGTRYISIVSSVRTGLPEGKYEFKLYAPTIEGCVTEPVDGKKVNPDDDKCTPLIVKKGFTITKAESTDTNGSN